MFKKGQLIIVSYADGSKRYCIFLEHDRNSIMYYDIKGKVILKMHPYYTITYNSKKELWQITYG